MANPPVSRSPDCWQLCGRHAVLRLAAAEAPETGPEPPGLIDRMADAIEQLDRATAEGWRLVGVKLLRQPAGFYRLDALLARPRPVATVRPAAAVPSAVHPPAADRAA